MITNPKIIEDNTISSNLRPSFKRFLWNSDEKKVLGRTADSWFKIVIFYIFFYIALALFFGVYLYLHLFHLSLIDDIAPKWKLSESLIGANPGMGFRPSPDQNTHPDSTLIRYKYKNEIETTFWSRQVEDFVNTSIAHQNDDKNQLSCNYEGTNRATKTKSCKIASDFDLNSPESPCNSANAYGYPKGEPCIVLKLNKIYGWDPEGYGLNSTNEYDKTLLENELALEKEKNSMPDWLIDYIKQNVETAPNPSGFLNTIWISCGTKNPADMDNIGIFEYFPQPGIPGYYFPYYNQKGYKSPFIIMKMKRPSKEVLINIECKAWARNIHPDRFTRAGSVNFQIFIE